MWEIYTELDEIVKTDSTGTPTEGIGGGKFGPDMTCTRAQTVTVLFRSVSK